MIYFELAKPFFFQKTRFKPNLWLFSTFFGPFWHFYYQIGSFRYKIKIFWPISVYKTLYYKKVFENELKGGFWPLCNYGLARMGRNFDDYLPWFPVQNNLSILFCTSLYENKSLCKSCVCFFLYVSTLQCTVIKISQNNNLPINYPNDLRYGSSMLSVYFGSFRSREIEST